MSRTGCPDPLALPRLTIRAATSLEAFGRIVEGDAAFLVERTLTRGTRSYGGPGGFCGMAEPSAGRPAPPRALRPARDLTVVPPTVADPDAQARGTAAR